MRLFWPDLPKLMLFWPCAPVSTAGLERGFSFQTLNDQDTHSQAPYGGRLRDGMPVLTHNVSHSQGLVQRLPVPGGVLHVSQRVTLSDQSFNVTHVVSSLAVPV
jgi:hypothetical protein